MKASERKYPGYIVYLYWQPDADKMYVGITKTGCIDDRAKGGRGYIKKCPHLSNAIEKYGWDSFAKEVLQYGLTKEEAEEWERYYIAKWDLQNPDKGYNIKSGGHCGTGISEEGRISMREKNSGLNANKQRPVCVFDLDGKKIGWFPLISFAADHYGIKRGTIINSLRKGNYPCFGMIFKYADEVGDADSLSAGELSRYLEKKDITGANSYNARAVVVFDSVSGKRLWEFSTLTEARAALDGDVFGTLSGRQKTFGNNYTARYREDVGDILELPEAERYDPSLALPFHRHGVRQYSKDGKFIAEYVSTVEASRRTGVGHSNIHLSASDGSKTAGGYIWRFCDSDRPVEKIKTTWEQRWENGTSFANAVDQVDLETGEVLATYRSIHAASDATGVTRRQISLVCKDPSNHKSGGGYGWRFHEE